MFWMLPYREHHTSIVKRILENNDFGIDERYFDVCMKQKLVQQLFKLQQGTDKNLHKLGAHAHFVQQIEQQPANVCTPQNQFLVFNLVSLKSRSL